METPELLYKLGRPRAIPENMIPVVTALYHRGYGYRAISRILGNEHGVTCHYTTVKRVLKRLGLLDKRDRLIKNEIGVYFVTTLSGTLK